jgi:hypothetical protein
MKFVATVIAKERRTKPTPFAVTLLNDLAAAGAEREETNSAPAHAPRCRHSAARNATACLTSASNNAFTGCRRAMNRTVDWMGCSCDRQRKTRDEERRKDLYTHVLCLSFRPSARKRPNPGKVPARCNRRLI